MKTQTVKTIKTFPTVHQLINYLLKVGYTEKTPEEINREIEKKSLIKYDSILCLYDPYNLI